MVQEPLNTRVPGYHRGHQRVIFVGQKILPAASPENRHDVSSQLIMKIAEGEFQAQPSEKSSSGETGVPPVTDGQDARPTKTRQSSADRHCQAGVRERAGQWKFKGERLVKFE